MLIRVLPRGGLLSVSKREAGRHLLRVHRCSCHVSMVMGIVRQRRLSKDVFKRRVWTMSLLLVLLLLLLLILLRVLRGTVAPWLQN